KTGTSENFFDAWFIGFTPELVTGTWMGYAEGGETLEYVLEYARKLHGLPGGITPAQIWKSYTQVIMRGEPIEQFDGVEIPETEDRSTAPEHGAKNTPAGARKQAPTPSRARERAPKTRRAAASASASSVAPSRARPTRAERAGAARYRDARSSASAAPR
ncbi:MAG: hypothetical protein M3385_09185, partial [Actinomycetota bacterium]|nr:hypothetical protein [Actinomycetota bacterium]